MTDEKKSDKKLIYKSVNGFNVYCGKNDVVEECDPKLLELFTDSVSLDMMLRPIYLPCSKQIYDQTTISKWLATSNKDPLTGINIETGKLTYVPVIPYFVAMLCLESVGDKLYFHKPNMHIIDLLIIGYNLFNRSKFCSADKVNIECKDGVYEAQIIPTLDQKYVYLRSEFYVRECTVDKKLDYSVMTYPLYNIHVNGLSKDSTVLNVNNIQYTYDILLSDILTRCPFSGRIFESACITSRGIFIHQNMPNDIDIPNLMEYRDPRRLISAISKSTRDSNNVVKLHKFTEFFERKNSEKKFVIDWTNEQGEMIEYKNLENLEKINFNNVQFNSVLVNYFYIQPISELPDGDMIHCTSTDIVIYEKYLKVKNNVDKHVQDKISEYVNSKECTFETRDDKKENKVTTLRRLFKYPTFYDDDHDAYFTIMGGDYSLLNIKNKEIYDVHLKHCWFVGSTFEHVIFQDCRFSACKFIGTELITDIIFINCQFDDCTFFKSTFSNSLAFFKDKNNSFDPDTVETFISGMKYSSQSS